MPSTRSSNSSGGGILKRKDGTIVGIRFTPDNPLFKDNEPKEDAKFIPLWFVLTILEDGREDKPTEQPLRVGDVRDFEIVNDGHAVSGTKAFRKSEGFMIFKESLEKPRDGGEGQNPDIYPEDPAGLVADFTPMIGTRVMFDTIEDTSDWAKKNPRKAKDKDGKPLMKDGKQVTYPRTHLVVAQYYGQVDVSKLNVAKPAGAGKTVAAAAKAATTGSRPAARSTAPATTSAPALDPVAVQARAEEEILKAVQSGKGRPVSRTKLLVKLLSQLGGEPQQLNDAVRLWADNDANLAQVDGIVYDGNAKTLSLEPVTA